MTMLSPAVTQTKPTRPLLPQSGGVVQSYVDGCCKTCESRKSFPYDASQATLLAVNQRGERLVAWQWMGLLAEWFWGCGQSYRVESRPVAGIRGCYICTYISIVPCTAVGPQILMVKMLASL